MIALVFFFVGVANDSLLDKSYEGGKVRVASIKPSAFFARCLARLRSLHTLAFTPTRSLWRLDGRGKVL